MLFFEKKSGYIADDEPKRAFAVSAEDIIPAFYISKMYSYPDGTQQTVDEYFPATGRYTFGTVALDKSKYAFRMCETKEDDDKWLSCLTPEIHNKYFESVCILL